MSIKINKNLQYILAIYFILNFSKRHLLRINRPCKPKIFYYSMSTISIDNNNTSFIMYLVMRCCQLVCTGIVSLVGVDKILKTRIPCKIPFFFCEFETNFRDFYQHSTPSLLHDICQPEKIIEHEISKDTTQPTQ